MIIETKTLFRLLPGSSSISNAEKELQETYPDMKWQKGRLLNGVAKEDIKKWTKK